jgi:hypothetical protein
MRVVHECCVGVSSGAAVGASSTFMAFFEYEPQYAPDIIKGSQMFYRNYGVHGSELVAKCESHLLGDSEVSLTPTPDSTIGKLGFGISLIGFSNLVLVKHYRVKWR